MAYAFIEEVWGNHVQSQPKKVKKDPACGLYRKRLGKDEPLDDIMNAYMDDPYERYERSSYGSKKFEKREQMDHEIDLDPKTSHYDVSSPELEPPGNKKCFDAERLEGVYEPMLKNTFEYDQYYNQLGSGMGAGGGSVGGGSAGGGVGVRVEDEAETYIDASGRTHSVPPREEIYRDVILEKYIDYLKNDNHQYNPKGAYMDLVLYVGSGILLIFMMEQLLQLGTYLKISSR